jgi:threonine dehydrogenase-like Zn-dependent dehydrogenase
MGADEVRAPDKGNRRLAQRRHPRGEFDVVIEAAGVQSALDLSCDLVKKHGRIVIVGHHKTQDGLRTVNMNQWNWKALDIVNGHVHKYDEKLEAMREGVALMQQGRLDVTPLVTFYPLSQVQRAFDDLCAKKEGLFKAAIIPDEKIEGVLNNMSELLPSTGNIRLALVTGGHSFQVPPLYQCFAICRTLISTRKR